MLRILVICGLMKTWKWIMISVAGLAVVGGGAGWVAIQSLLKNGLSREAVVQQMEAQWNCRVELEDLKAEVFASPARLVLTNMNIGPRDAEVAKPLAQRVPMPQGTGFVHVDSAVLEVDLPALMQKKVHVQSLGVTGAYVRDDVSVEGVSGLAQIFLPPPSAALPSAAAVNAPAKPAASEAPGSAGETKTGEPVATVPQPEVDSDLSLRIEEILLEGVVLHFRNRQAKTVNDVNKLRLRISDVDVQQSNLAAHNTAKIELSGQVVSTGRARVGEVIKDVPVANFAFSSSGVVQPYEVDTRLLNPSATLSVKLDKGSVFGGTSTLGEAAAKDKTFEQMKKNFGIDVTDVVLGGPLQEEAVIDVTLKSSRVEFSKDTRFSFPDYVVTLRQGSWLNAEQDTHESHLLLVPSEVVAKRIVEGVKTKTGDGLADMALGIFNDGNGKLAFDIVSTGRLSRPKFALGGKAGQIEQMFKGLGGGLLKGLLGQ